MLLLGDAGFLSAWAVFDKRSAFAPSGVMGQHSSAAALADDALGSTQDQRLEALVNGRYISFRAHIVFRDLVTVEVLAHVPSVTLREESRFNVATSRAHSLKGRAGVPPMRAPGGTSSLTCAIPAI